MNNSAIEIFKSDDGKTEVQVVLENDTVWLNQYQIEELFQTNRTSVNRHILNIYKSKELQEDSTCAKIAQVQKEGVLYFITKNHSFTDGNKRIVAFLFFNLWNEMGFYITRTV